MRETMSERRDETVRETMCVSERRSERRGRTSEAHSE